MKKIFYGFTLIEMLVAVAIIGIIAAIALPSYQATIRKSNRAEAKTQLVDVAQRLQRCYTLNAKFNANCDIYTTLTSAAGYRTTGGGYYKITIASLTGSGQTAANSFRLTATADRAPQTNDVMSCRTLTLDHTGLKTPSQCW